MNQDRKSERLSTVNKRKDLEEKVAKRKVDADVKKGKSRSKEISELRQQELNLFTEEARILSESVDRLYQEYLDLDPEKEEGSLEWDSDEITTSPTFSSENTVISLLEENALKIIEQSLDESDENHEENLVSQYSSFRESRRKNTSTDIGFLESSTPVIHNSLNWPPRFPSQEPEDLPVNDLLLSVVVPEPLIEIEDEVFGPATTMDSAAYETRYRVVKVASRKVKDKQKRFLAVNVTSTDVPDYKNRLKEIRDSLDLFDDAISDLVVDLDEKDQDDKVKIDALEIEQANLLQEVLDNETNVKAKIKELLESQPITKAEQEALDIERKKLLIEEQKDEKEKEHRGKKVEIDIVDISSRIEALMETVEKVKPSEKLTDQEVKQSLLEAKKWENKLDEIKALKVKLDKELVGLVVDELIVEKLAMDSVMVAKGIKEKMEDLTTADISRQLFTLTKPVKEVAVYPAPFGGTPEENIYKFLDKMLEVLTANQIREKDRVDVLKKHLKGFPKNLINDAQKTFEQAKTVLLDTYGSPHVTWKAKLESFKKKCNNPKGWSSHGQRTQFELIASTCNFLAEAKQFAEDHKEMSETINSAWTANAVIAVIPRAILDKVYNNNKGLSKENWSVVLDKIKEQMDEENQIALMDHKCSEGVKENTVAYNKIMSNFNREKPQQLPQRKDQHDCKYSKTCKTVWGGLGCSVLYTLHTTNERMTCLKKRNLCVWCGQHYHGVQKSPGRCDWSAIEAVRCQFPGCKVGAAICNKHQEGNASQELKDWITKMNIKTTVSTIYSFPCQHRSASIPSTTDVSEKVRSKLQSGQMSSPFTDEQLVEFFEKDFKKVFKKKVEVRPIPEGEVAFIFCKIKGRQNDVQAFIDHGCNCAIFREGVPQREFRSCLLKEGPIQIDVATGLSVQAQGEWALNLPLTDGSVQLVRCLTVPKVTTDMPVLRLRKLMNKIKSDNEDNPEAEAIQNLQVPENLGGEIDAIIGIQFASVHPEEVFTFPSGLKIYKSKFVPARKGELACIGGPLGVLDIITGNSCARSAVGYLANLLSNYSSGYVPKVDFFPSSDMEMDRGFEMYADKAIPEIEGLIDAELEHQEDLIAEEQDVQEDLVAEDKDVQEDLVAEERTFDESMLDNKINDKKCVDCNEIIAAATIQSEIKGFLQSQETGLDTSFRCIRCRDCKLCLKGAGQERMSIRQEAEQEVIRESVMIDKKLGRAVAKLPFIVDPTDKLKDNSRVAAKRLENVIRKYSSDKNIKEMLDKSMKKLIDNGHIVFLDDLPPEQRARIKHASPSYTIPADVAFKEGSVSTPARWVFDAGSKTSLGYSLNDLLAKGIIDMVRLIDMVLDWRVGPSAFCGDIRQFYNSILLSEEFWQFQKVLFKESLDNESKMVTGIIKTLIYGVKPVGNQCEEVIKLLVDDIKESFPDVARLLLYKRYVDDFGQSTTSEKQTVDLINKTTTVLGKIKMKVKGWAVSGADPPEEITEDKASVGFAGMTWFPRGDFFKLNIQSLHFSKKKRGRFPSNLLKFENTSGISVEEFTPENITRTNCTSVTARIYDIQGLLAPLTLKLKSDLRTLISFEPSWTATIPDHQRTIWINNFKIIEEVRDILYVRCAVPADAISCKPRILLLCDAANSGIILGAYASYERPGKQWSCDLLFGKGLLAPDNWTIPQKELHGMSALSNLKIILENALDNWISEFQAFSDSEIALSWVIYEKVKLTTFIRNRVINIRTKMGLDILHHVEGKNNPTDVGTRPEEITAESVRPGSVWLKGKPWMKMSLDEAKETGAIKHVDDIKLSHEKKKVFKEGIIFDTFEENDLSVFAVAGVLKVDLEKVKQRMLEVNYIFPPLKRKFESLVRITALVLRYINKLRRRAVKNLVEIEKKTQKDLESLDAKQPIFSIFTLSYSAHEIPMQEDYPDIENALKDEKPLTEYFNINGVNLSNTAHKGTVLLLTDQEISDALEDLFWRTSLEVKAFNDPKYVNKIAVEENKILYCKSRLLESAELRTVGHLANALNLKSFSGVNFKVPVLDKHSPVAISIANHLHYVKYPHKGAESLYRLCLQFCNILGGRQLFNTVSTDCIFCAKMQKKLLKQIMGPLSDSQITISPVFYFTIVDLWGPLTSYVPGYEKLGVTRSTADKSYSIYVMVFVCVATGTVNTQVIEGKDTGFCLDGFNRFFCETTVPKIVYTDEEGGLVKALKEAEVEIIDLEGNLTKRGIQFETCTPQGHSAHGKVEKKIHLLQQSLERAEFRNSRCTATGWMCIMKLIERQVNSIPIGYLYHQAGGNNPLLRILSPNNLKLITMGDRAPVGTFKIPDKPGDIMEKIDQKYENWYKIWNEFYLPLIMNRKKWHERSENLVIGDIVYFKLTESKMSAAWRSGKVESVKIGADGFVRTVTIAYKDISADDAEDWTHRTVDRPVRNLVKIFHIDETSFMEDLDSCHNEVVEILKSRDDVRADFPNEKETMKKLPESKNEQLDTNLDDVEEELDEEINDDDTQAQEINPTPVSKPKQRKKRRTELEKLEIDLKGWSFASSLSAATRLSAVRYQAPAVSKEMIRMMGVDEDRLMSDSDNQKKDSASCRGVEEPDYQFNKIVMNDTLDINNQLYLL